MTQTKTTSTIPYNTPGTINIHVNNPTANAPSIESAFMRFMEFIGNDVLIAHNSSFDCRFLGTVCAILNETIDNSVLDSVQIAAARR